MASPLFIQHYRTFSPIPKRISDGLILELNVANTSSYTGANGSVTDGSTFVNLGSGVSSNFRFENNSGTLTAYIESQPKYISMKYYDVGYANTLTDLNYVYGDYIYLPNFTNTPTVSMNVAAGTGYNTASRTVECWARITAPPQSSATTDSPYGAGSVLFGGSSGTSGVLRLFDNGNDTCNLCWTWDDSAAAGTNTLYHANEIISLNTWNQIVVVLEPPDAGPASSAYKCAYYINGVSAGNIVSDDEIGLTTLQTWYIGRGGRAFQPSPTNGFRYSQFVNCDVSIFRQYNRALTANEIKQNYNAERSKFRLRTNTNTPQPPVVTGFNPDYPRLHAHCAGIKTVDSAVDTVIARHHTSMHGLERNFSSGGYNLATFPAYVKSLGNSNLKMFNAQAVVQTYNQLNGSAGYAVAVYDKMFAEQGPNGVGDWWLRTATGDNIQGYSNQLWRRNITTLVTPDSQGRNNNEWHFQWLYAASTDGVDRVTGGYGMREGAWDGLYEDDQYLSGSFSPTNADYNEDGVADNPLNATVQQWIIDGHWSYRNAMKAAEPNWYFMGNIAGYLAEVDSGDYAMPASLVGINDAAIFERINQREFYAGWSAMMQRYRLGLSWLSGPEIGVFLVDLDTTRDLYATPGDAPRIAAFEYSQYRWNRYWLCSCLMDNGFYSVADGPADGQGNTSYSIIWWFDEFWGGDDVQQVGYLGQPIDPPQTSAYSNGVYVREFENGLVVLNPGNGGYTAGPGAKTITLPSPGAGYQWKRLSGSQDAAVNTGQVQSSSLTINERDGIILRRVAV